MAWINGKGTEIDNLQVIAVDARNHGESPHSPHHRYVDLAEDVHLFCKEHNISKTVVVGHSMGGKFEHHYKPRRPN